MCSKDNKWRAGLVGPDPHSIMLTTRIRWCCNRAGSEGKCTSQRPRTAHLSSCRNRLPSRGQAQPCSPSLQGEVESARGRSGRRGRQPTWAVVGANPKRLLWQLLKRRQLRRLRLPWLRLLQGRRQRRRHRRRCQPRACKCCVGLERLERRRQRCRLALLLWLLLHDALLLWTLLRLWRLECDGRWLQGRLIRRWRSARHGWWL
mmetsp:Transcript_82804/g.184867  ORF Transcript_82804/g.184867 Transcript_82804/m.184867 type:complete len:204 (-) Transcript_82804:1255-1866(-)